MKVYNGKEEEEEKEKREEEEERPTLVVAPMNFDGTSCLECRWVKKSGHSTAALLLIYRFS